MKKLIVVGLLLFWGCWCFGQQDAWNGTRWKILSLSEKTCYVAGFERGYAAGTTDGIAADAEVLRAVKPPGSWTPTEKRIIEQKAKQMDEKSATTASFTIGQVVDTVSTFYDDYRNAPVCWDDAIKFSRLSLTGTAPSEVELSAAPKADAEGGCR